MAVSKQSGPLKNQIRRLRFEHGEMTQQELANRAGVTRQTIIALEAGKYTPSLLLAFHLARAFGVDGPVRVGEHSTPSGVTSGRPLFSTCDVDGAACLRPGVRGEQLPVARQALLANHLHGVVSAICCVRIRQHEVHFTRVYQVEHADRRPIVGRTEQAVGTRIWPADRRITRPCVDECPDITKVSPDILSTPNY